VVRVSLPVSWFDDKDRLSRAVHKLKSGMDPKKNVSRLAGTTTGGHSCIAGNMVATQPERMIPS
jgi:hypothetical protein